MSTALAAKIASLLGDKKVRKFIPLLISFAVFLIFMLLLFPFLIVSMVVMTLNPMGEDLQKDLYYQTIAEVKSDYEISNDLSPYILKAIDFTQMADMRTSKPDIYGYIADDFIRSEEVEIQTEVETEVLIDGEYETITETVTETITVYYFLTLGEIIDMILNEPYLFTDEDVRLIQSLYFEEADIDITLKGKYPMPMSGYISSGYGDRIDPLNGKYFMHPALDIVGEHHAPVKAIADGTVVEINKTEGNIYGNTVTIRHEQNDDVFYSFSAHLSRVDVVQGQQIPQGQTIGLEGGDQSSDPNPGRTTGHHLHFEIWTGSTRTSHVNPSLYLGE